MIYHKPGLSHWENIEEFIYYMTEDEYGKSRAEILFRHYLDNGEAFIIQYWHKDGKRVIAVTMYQKHSLWDIKDEVYFDTLDGLLDDTSMYGEPMRDVILKSDVDTFY